MNNKNAIKLIKKTQKDYNNFAEEFSKSRNSAWPEFKWISKYVEAESKILELGCGNGRLFDALKEKRIDYTGIDFSSELLKIARKKYPNVDFIEQDITQLDTKDETYDVIISIATIHHIPSRKLRKRTMKKISQALKPDGKLIISVWNLWHSKNIFILIKALLHSLATLGKYSWNDCFIPWKNTEGKPIMRYYHAFTKQEFKKLIGKSGFEIVAEYPESDRNFTFVCKQKVAKTVQHPLFAKEESEQGLSGQPQPATSQKL